MSFEVSTAKLSITPTLDMNPYMAGYGVQTGSRVAESGTPYREPLYARCVVLWDGEQPNAIISVDILAIPRSVHQSLIGRLIALASWDQSNIIVQSTHTHNGPALTASLDPFTSYGLSDRGPLQTYTNWFQDQIVAAVSAALNAAKTAVTLDYAVTSMNFAYNRAGLSHAETALSIITARKSDGTPRAVIFSYGCHPVSAGWQLIFDGDWPAGACTTVEAASPGVFALFLQGAAGDQNPNGTFGFPLRDQLSVRMGNAVVSTIATTGRNITGPLITRYTEAQLPLDVTPASLAAVRACFEVRIANPQGQPAWFQRHAEVAISLIDSQAVQTSVPNPSQVWQFQGSPGLAIALTGGELVSGYAVYFRARYGGTASIIVGGYANEVGFYVPANNLLPPLAPMVGSYEGGWDDDFPGIAGGSFTVYPQVGHFLAGVAGVESAVIETLTAQLS